MAWNKLSSYRTAIGSNSVTYAGTTIVEWSPETVTLRTNNWLTVTTKRKLNQASRQFGLGYGVYQKDFAWYIYGNGRDILWDGSPITLDRREYTK